MAESSVPRARYPVGPQGHGARTGCAAMDRTSTAGDPSDDHGAPSVASSIAAALRGDATAQDRLAAFVDRARDERDGTAIEAVAGPVAAEAAAGSRPALELLLFLVERCRLSDAALWSVLTDPHAVDDARQETVVAVVRGMSTFRGKARFTTWLHRVARNAAMRVVRERRKGAGEGPPDENVSGLSRSLSSVVADRVQVERAIDSLPTLFRDPLVLREFDQLEYEAIAQRLSLPLGTVRSRIARARARLACALTDSIPAT